MLCFLKKITIFDSVISEIIFRRALMEIKVLDHEAVLDMLPERDPDGHKGKFC